MPKKSKILEMIEKLKDENMKLTQRLLELDNEIDDQRELAIAELEGLEASARSNVTDIRKYALIEKIEILSSLQALIRFY